MGNGAARGVPTGKVFGDDDDDDDDDESVSSRSFNTAPVSMSTSSMSTSSMLEVGQCDGKVGNGTSPSPGAMDKASASSISSSSSDKLSTKVGGTSMPQPPPTTTTASNNFKAITSDVQVGVNWQTN